MTQLVLAWCKQQKWSAPSEILNLSFTSNPLSAIQCADLIIQPGSGRRSDAENTKTGKAPEISPLKLAIHRRLRNNYPITTCLCENAFYIQNSMEYYISMQIDPLSPVFK